MSIRLNLLLLIALPLLIPPSLVAQQPETSPPSTVAAPGAADRPMPSDPPHPSTATVEHWDKPALRDNNLRADIVIPGEVDRYPEFTRELLRVQWRGGDPIDLYLIRPVGVAKPPVVLYLYGYPEEANRFLNDNLCKTVTRSGFAAVGFSSMLTGQRYHDVPMKEWFVSELPQSLVGSAHDVQMILNYLSGRNEFDMSRVGIFGEGSGGTIALLAASVEPRLKAVDVLDPWGDWPTWLATSPLVPQAERPDYLKPEFLSPLAPLDPVNLLPKLTATRLRVQQTKFDTVVPAASADRIAAAVPATADKAQYSTQQEYVERVGSNGRMLDWMYAHLPAAGAVSSASSVVH